ncbi:hypothetical protein [Arthrobacter bambusae]|uniref:hypothetical protein n=1 Tax=Arthrobacter bambusae TaxID=1338426 RepID=UPI0027832D93|nr:hypothetical protein [Arthrobacter bambusae]MDQ0029499.1 hypothetical protein [Arthrobacter bambusae]MDQ0097159.1 hypothetical protein [Arthrobacter bambusae]
MENKQESRVEIQNVEFHVSYLDTLSGRIGHEEFSDRSAAERFAAAQLKDEDSWAVVDIVALQPARQQERARQLVA